MLKEIEKGTKKMKKKHGSRSAQSIWLDEEGEEENGAAELQPTVPKKKTASDGEQVGEEEGGAWRREKRNVRQLD